MSQKEQSKSSLVQKLEQIYKSKKHTKPSLRRYTDSERSPILRAADEMNAHQVSAISGIRPSTISVWKRRFCSESKTDATEEGHYDGYHKHWRRVLDLWKSKLGLGPAQLSNQMRSEGIRISVSTVCNILEENGYAPPLAKQRSERVFRYEAARPRELVHMDFKHAL